MAKAKKWEIKEVKKNQRVSNAAKTILKLRFDHLLITIENYFHEMNEENLHEIRIALRRVRYNMELFLCCFNRKQFFNTYNAIQVLQDLSGEVRDLDVFKTNIDSLIKDEKVKVNKNVLTKVEDKRIKFEDDFKLALMKFIHSKSIKNFYKQLV